MSEFHSCRVEGSSRDNNFTVGSAISKMSVVAQPSHESEKNFHFSDNEQFPRSHGQIIKYEIRIADYSR